MRTILQGCAIALAIAGVCALLEGALLLRDLRRQVDSSSMSVASVAASVNKLLATANDAAEQLREAAAQANQAAKDESGYFQKTSLEVYKTSAAARQFLVYTDRSLNDVLVPQLDASLADTDALLRQTAIDLHASATAIAPTLDSLAQASAAAATAMADPH